MTENTITKVGVIFWNSILGCKIIGFFKIDEGGKINTENYCKFLD